MTIYHLSALDILSKIQLLNRLTGEHAYQYRQLHNDEWEKRGWHRVYLDLHPLLDLFTPLRLTPGWRLQMYRFKGLRISKVRVWAIPNDAPFPEPEEFNHPVTDMFSVPKPPLAREPMSLILGDNSPESYLLALLLSEFLQGVCNGETTWDLMTLIIDYDRLSEYPIHNRGLKDEIDELNWISEKVNDWRPMVSIDGDLIHVLFYSYSSIHRMLFRYEGTFRDTGYEPISFKETVMAR